jgi:hypothetical protein
MRGTARPGDRARRRAARALGRARPDTHPARRDARRDVAARRTQGHRAGLPRDASRRSASDSTGHTGRAGPPGKTSALDGTRHPRAQRHAHDPRRAAPRAAPERLRDCFPPARQAARRRARVRAPEGARPARRARRLRDRPAEPGDAPPAGEDRATARARPRPSIRRRRWGWSRPAPRRPRALPSSPARCPSIPRRSRRRGPSSSRGARSRPRCS